MAGISVATKKDSISSSVWATNDLFGMKFHLFRNQVKVISSWSHHFPESYLALAGVHRVYQRYVNGSQRNMSGFWIIHAEVLRIIGITRRLQKFLFPSDQQLRQGTRSGMSVTHRYIGAS